MNIAILTDKLITSGGAERYVRNMIRALLKAGDTVDCFTTKVALPEELLSQPKLTIHRQNLSWCPRKLRYIWFNRYLRRQLAARRYDMILGIGTPYSPDIAICCGTHIGDMLTNKRRLLNPLNWVRVYYDWKKYRSARITLVRSKNQKDEVVRLLGIPSARVDILPPPTTATFRPPSANEKKQLRTRYALKPDKKYFLLVSNNHHRKGLMTVIRAIEHLRRDDCEVLVAGAGRGRFPDLPFIHWLGYVNNVVDVYRMSDAVMLQSRYEPFGQVVTEAILSGLPVFISDRVGAADIIDEGMGWVTPHGDVRKLADAIKEFLQKPAPVPEDSIAHIRDTLSITRHIETLKKLAQ